MRNVSEWIAALTATAGDAGLAVVCEEPVETPSRTRRLPAACALDPADLARRLARVLAHSGLPGGEVLGPSGDVLARAGDPGWDGELEDAVTGPHDVMDAEADAHDGDAPASMYAQGPRFIYVLPGRNALVVALYGCDDRSHDEKLRGAGRAREAVAAQFG